MNSDYREARRQLDGFIDSANICVPCRRAIFDDDILRIGHPSWINDGFPDCEELDKPALYCCFCRHILRAREYARRRGLSTSVPQPSLDWVLMSMFQGIFIHDHGVDLDGADSGEISSFEVERDSCVQSIQDRFVSFDFLKTCVKVCEEQHGDVCNRSHFITTQSQTPLLLVDAQENCLVRSNFNARYYALSYVWGKSKQFRAVKANIEDLLRPGSLSTAELPQTIKDSITLVVNLAGRYLWVDTLCIVQDNYDNKQEQINQIGYIYSNAIATIIALNGDSANAGLSGIPPTPRNTDSVLVAPGLCLVERTPLSRVLEAIGEESKRYPYNSRAWTFQERLLSRRSIYFLNEQVYFHCEKILVSEDRYITDHMNVGEKALATLKGTLTTSGLYKTWWKDYGKYDDFRYYEEFVEEYTGKNMGYPIDIINAFSGILAALMQQYNWTAVFGLPDKVLDLALLWTPVESIKPRQTREYFPSWSWSGWLGQVWYKDLYRPLQNFSSIHNLIKPLADIQVREHSKYSRVLHFYADTVHYTSFRFERSPRRLYQSYIGKPVTGDVFFIFDGNDRRCGIQYGHWVENLSNQSPAQDQETVALVVLSSWARANSMMSFGPVIGLGDDYNFADEELFDRTFENSEWNTYNFLLVRISGDYCTRIGAGQINRDAWTKVKPARKEIILI